MKVREAELNAWLASIVDAASAAGHSVPAVKIRLMTNDELAKFIALAGLPVRYRHFSIYQAYLILQRRKLGGISLSEHVTNTHPHIIPVAYEDSRAKQYLCVANGVMRAVFMRQSDQFAHTRPDLMAYMAGQHAEMVADIIARRDVDDEHVRETLTAAHALRLVRDFPQTHSSFSLLAYIAEHSPSLDDWQRDLLRIVDYETKHFAPHIGTRVLQAGFAAYWQQIFVEQLLHQQDPKLYDSVMLAHARFVRRYPDVEKGERLNPHFIGEVIMRDIMVREPSLLQSVVLVLDDVTALRMLLNEDLVARLGLVREVTMPEQIKEEYAGTPIEVPARTPFVLDVSDDVGWESVLDVFLMRLGFGWWPNVSVSGLPYPSLSKGIMLLHKQDIGELDNDEAMATIAHTQRLWAPGAIIQTYSQTDKDTVYYICHPDGKTERRRANPPKFGGPAKFKYGGF